MLTTPDSRRYSMSGGPTCGVSSAKSGRRKTVSCCGQDESYAAGVATDASVSPDWLSRQHHAALFSNAKGQRGAACGASAAPTGCASNGNHNERTEK